MVQGPLLTMVLVEKSVEGESVVPVRGCLLRTPCRERKGAYGHFLQHGSAQRSVLRPPGTTVSLGLAFGTGEILQCDMAWLHLSTCPGGGMDKRNVILDTLVANRTGV